MKKNFLDFIREEDGSSTVEVVLVLLVIVGIIFIFKKQITSIINSIFSSIKDQVNDI